MRRAACTYVVGLGLAASAASASCSSKNEVTSPPIDGGMVDTGAADTATASNDGSVGNEWVIGVSDSLSGALKGIGGPLQNAVRVAETYINSNGGILDKQVKFVILDDTSDETPGDSSPVSKTIAKLLGQGVSAVIGPNGSAQVGAVQNALYMNQVIQITATGTSTALTGCAAGVTTDCTQPLQDRYLFRTVPADDFQGRAVVRFAVAGPPGSHPSGDAGSSGAVCKRLALFYVSNSYGTKMAQVVKDNFPNASGGGTIVTDISVATTVQADYQTQVNQIIAAKPDCLSMITYDDVGDKFLTDLKAAIASPPSGWNSSFFVIGTDGTYTQDLIDNGRLNKADPSSPTVAEGVYGTNPDTNPLTSDYSDFKNRYVSQFPLSDGKTDVDPYAANEFDAAMLIALAIAQAGGTSDKVALRDALYKVASKGKVHGPGDLTGALQDIQNGIDIDYSGASGPVDLDPAGNVTAGYIIWHVKDGKFEIIDRYKSTDLQ